MKGTRNKKSSSSSGGSVNITEAGKKDMNDELKKIISAIFGYEIEVKEEVMNVIRESCERFLKYTISRMPSNCDEYDSLSYVLRMDRLKKARLTSAHKASQEKESTKKETKYKQI